MTSTATGDAPAKRRPPQVRPAPLLLGLAAAALAAALAGLSLLGPIQLAVGVGLVQLLLVLGILAFVDAPADTGAFIISALAAVAADVVVLLREGQVDGLAGVGALALVSALLHQLLRGPRRVRVTESLADTLVAVVLVVSLACLVALAAVSGGEEVTPIALAAGGAALLAGRLGDRLLARPPLAVGSARGWLGLILGLAAGVAAGVLVAGDDGRVVSGQGALLGLAVAAAVAAADLAVDLGAVELRPVRRDARRADALRPVGLLLPFAALGPVALVAGRLVLV